MDLRTFVTRLTPSQRREFCQLADTSPAYLSQLANGHRHASAKMAKKLVHASEQLPTDDPIPPLTLAGIRPDIWGEAA